jgi:hypothetical protein
LNLPLPLPTVRPKGWCPKMGVGSKAPNIFASL